MIDPERFRDNAEEPMAARGMGAVYSQTAYGQQLRHPISPDNREQLLRDYYDPHHAVLTQIVAEALEEGGECLIIDAHSFPTIPLPCDMSQEQPRPDICIGTDPFHTPRELVDLAENAFLSQGWTVGIDWPYKGALVPMDFYRTDSRVRTIMVEVRRGLYMVEGTGENIADFDYVRDKLQNSLRRIIEPSDV